MHPAPRLCWSCNKSSPSAPSSPAAAAGDAPAGSCWMGSQGKRSCWQVGWRREEVKQVTKVALAALWEAGEGDSGVTGCCGGEGSLSGSCCWGWGSRGALAEGWSRQHAPLGRHCPASLRAFQVSLLASAVLQSSPAARNCKPPAFLRVQTQFYAALRAATVPSPFCTCTLRRELPF